MRTTNWASFHQTKHICWGSASLSHDSGAVCVAAANHSSLNLGFRRMHDCNTWTHLRSQDKLRTFTADYAITTMNRDTTLCENGSIWGGLAVHLCRLVCLQVFFFARCFSAQLRWTNVFCPPDNNSSVSDCSYNGSSQWGRFRFQQLISCAWPFSSSRLKMAFC